MSTVAPAKKSRKKEAYLTEIRSDDIEDFKHLPAYVNAMLHVKEEIGERPVGVRIGTTSIVPLGFNDEVYETSIPEDCRHCLMATSAERGNWWVLWISVLKESTLIARRDDKTGELWLEEYQNPVAVTKVIKEFDDDKEALKKHMPASAFLKPVRISNFTPNKNMRRRRLEKTEPGKGPGGARDTHRRYASSRKLPAATAEWV